MLSSPTKLELTPANRLRIAWSDGQVREYAFRELRDQCPCATCREKRKAPPVSPLQLPIISAAEAQPLRITAMKPVGNYAYSIEFSDGHNTGIYTLETLRAMGVELPKQNDVVPVPRMEWLKLCVDWLVSNAALWWWAIAGSLALLLITPVLVAWMIIKLPTDYFVAQRHRPLQSLERYPILRALATLAKNLLGIVVLVAGIIMLFTPGQGVLTIVVALVLIDFPGKYRLERWMITRPNVWRSVHWLRVRAGRPSLERPE